MNKKGWSTQQSLAAGLLLLSLLALVGIVDCIAADRTQIIQDKHATQQSPIRLLVSTSKRVYRVGEPVEVTVLLENTSSDRQYFVGRAIYEGDIPTALHYVDVALFDSRGRLSPFFDGASVQDPMERFGPDGKMLPKKTSPMAELTTLEYVLLQPGSVYGFRTRLYGPSSKSGHFKLSASYHELEALKRTAVELQGLAAPIWTEALISNVVEIAVVR